MSHEYANPLGFDAARGIPADQRDPVEQKVGELYVEFYRLRQAGKYQEEYDAMGALLSMLSADRAHIRKTYGVTP